MEEKIAELNAREAKATFVPVCEDHRTKSINNKKTDHGTCLAENATCVCDEDYAGSDCSAYCPNCTVVEITCVKTLLRPY